MAQEPVAVYPPPLGAPRPPLPAAAEESGPGRVSPQAVLLGTGAVAVVAAGAATLTVGGPPGRGLVAVLACVAAAGSVRSGRGGLRTTEEVLAGCTAVLAVVATTGPGWRAEPAVLAGLALVLAGLGRGGPGAAAWPVGAWLTAQLAVLTALGDAAAGTLPHTAAVVGTALVGLAIARRARPSVARVGLVTAVPWAVAAVVEGLRSAWAAGSGTGAGAGAGALAAVLVVAVATGVVGLWSRPLLQPLLGPRALVPLLSGLAAGGAVAGALSAGGSSGVPATGYLGLGLAAAVAAKASPARESVVRPFGLTAACTLTALAVGQLLGAGRWPALSLMLVVAAGAALLVAARQPVDRPGALPAAVGCLAGAVLLADAGGVLPGAAAGALLLGLAVAALAVAAGLRGRPAEPSLAATGAVVGLVALLVPGSPGSAAPQLAVLGAALTCYGTRAARDGARAAGCAALVGAAWLTAATAGAAVPEAWTLPVAAGLLVYAGHRLADAPSWPGWGPGLVTGFAPPVVLAVADPRITRVLLVVAAATVAAVLGARRDVQAPLLVGAGSLVVVAVGRLVDALPWPGVAAVGVAGALLLVVGATYEHRRQQARGALARVADMR